MSRELGFDECADLLAAGVVGRVAVNTPGGPHIVPVNYTVVDEAVVVATSPYSVLGTYGRGAVVAFEVDQVDPETQEGWSVVARGRADAVEPVDLHAIRDRGLPRPWADGARTLHLRIVWSELSGRRIGGGDRAPVQPALGRA